MVSMWRGSDVWSCLWVFLAAISSTEARISTLEHSPASTTWEDGTAARLLANYIAAGIGITSLAPTSTLSTRPLSTGQSGSHSIQATISIASATHGLLATGGSANSTNGTCWNSWVDYWSSAVPYTVPATTSWVTVTDNWVYEPYLTTTVSISENSWTLTSLSTEYSDDYPISVHTSLTTSSAGGTFVTVTSYSTITTTSLRSYPATSYRTTTRSSITTPPCHLPSLVPQCESQWSSYMAEQDTITNELTPKPACTQASVNPSGCETLVSQYLFQWTWNGETEGAGYQASSNSTYWPTSKSFAPGCSLGCRACSITGQSVQLYWWPPATKGLVENGTRTATLAEEETTSRRGPVSVLVDGTYLTSPTIYISYNTLYASDSCSGIGATYTNTIIPLAQSSHLFSMETRWDPSISVHGFKTVPFDYSDLVEPIPDSVYNKQSRCQTSYTNFIKAGGLMRNATFSCTRTARYAPIIAVPGEVRGLDAAREGCEAWYGGLYDPPLALHPASVEATPTLSVSSSPPQASPSQSTDPGSPQQTALPSSQTQASDPSTSSQDGAEIVAGIFMTSSAVASATQPSIIPDQIDDGSKATTETTNDLHAVVTLNGETFSADGTHGTIFVNDMEAEIDRIVTISGHTFSVGSSAMVIDDVTVVYTTAVQPAPSAPTAAFTTATAPHQTTLSLDDQTFRIEQTSGVLLINGMQAEVDHPVTVSGHVFIADASMLEVDGTRVFTYASPASTGAQITEIVVGEHTVTAEKLGDGVVVDGETLSNGQVTTIDGALVSVVADGVVVETSTATLQDASAGPTTTNNGTGLATGSVESTSPSTRPSTTSVSTTANAETSPQSSSAARVPWSSLMILSIWFFLTAMSIGM